MNARLLRWAIGLVLLTTVIRLPSLLHPQLIGDERIYGFSVQASLLADHYSEVTRTREGIIYQRTSRGS